MYTKTVAQHIFHTLNEEIQSIEKSIQRTPFYRFMLREKLARRRAMLTAVRISLHHEQMHPETLDDETLSILTSRFNPDREEHRAMVRAYIPREV